MSLPKGAGQGPWLALCGAWSSGPESVNRQQPGLGRLPYTAQLFFAEHFPAPQGGWHLSSCFSLQSPCGGSPNNPSVLTFSIPIAFPGRTGS